MESWLLNRFSSYCWFRFYEAIYDLYSYHNEAIHDLYSYHNARYWTVGVGMHDRHHVYTTQVHHVRNLIVHTGYNSHTNLNDIALMKLDKPVDINTQYVRAACLPNAHDSFDQMTCTVTGWGATYFGESAT